MQWRGGRWLSVSAFLTIVVLTVGTSVLQAQQENAVARTRQVVINGTNLTGQQIAMVQAVVHRPVQSGIYWYDRMTGAWGFDGGPMAGLIAAGLPIGGPLRADASHGTTGVFINGRQLALIDAINLQRYTGSPVIPGRYWVDARGNFGYEGGPLLGNFNALAQQHGTTYGRQGNTVTSCAGGGCGSGNSNTGLGVITDGQGGAGVFTGDGHVISTP